jgi:hypothetical protein
VAGVDELARQAGAEASPRSGRDAGETSRSSAVDERQAAAEASPSSSARRARRRSPRSLSNAGGVLRYPSLATSRSSAQRSDVGSTVAAAGETSRSSVVDVGETSRSSVVDVDASQ